MNWDERFRQLEMGEKVLATDECYDNGKWTPAQGYVGKPAPDPRFTAHCVFRRLIDHPPTAEPKCEEPRGFMSFHCSRGVIGCRHDRPPTTEPAESEGKCPDCPHGLEIHDETGCCYGGSPVTMCHCIWKCPPTAPPAEPKCERCGATLTMYDSLDTVRDCPCPPTTEPAENEGKACEHHWSAGFQIVNGQNVHHCVFCQTPLIDPPAAPPAESVEDRARAFYKQSQSVWVHELMASFAQAEIERQTPAIISRFVEEVKKEFHPIEDDEEWDDSVCICFHCEAMQTVKAHREGGEGK